MVQLVTTTKCGQCHGGVSGHKLIRNSWEESSRKDLKCASPEVKKKKKAVLCIFLQNCCQLLLRANTYGHLSYYQSRKCVLAPLAFVVLACERQK